MKATCSCCTRCSPCRRGASRADTRLEPPMLRARREHAGSCRRSQKRLPEQPLVVKRATKPGQHGGTLNILIGRSRDMRMLVVYGYARLVGYDRNLELVPDMLESYRGEGRARCSPSSCARATAGPTASRSPPRTSATSGRTSRTTRSSRPPGRRRDLLVDGETPKVEVLSDTRGALHLVEAEPVFPAALAGASPLFIFRPAHYLKQFHEKYAREGAQGGRRRHGEAQLGGGAQPRGQPLPVRQSRRCRRCSPG